MTAEELALSLSDRIRQQACINNETRLGLAQIGSTRSVSIGSGIGNIKSLAFDLASLLVIGVHRDSHIVVYMPNARLCRRLLMFVYEGVRLILLNYPQAGIIRLLNTTERIQFSPAAGFTNSIWVYPTKPEFLRGVLFGDLILKATGNAAFDEAFDASGILGVAQSVVDLDFGCRQLSEVDELAQRVIAMDISPIE